MTEYAKLDIHTTAFAARGFAERLSPDARKAFVALMDTDRATVELAVQDILKQIAFEEARSNPPFDARAGGLVSALRYALPRKTSAGSFVTDAIKANWVILGDAIRHDIKNRIRTALAEGKAGHDIDRKDWAEILKLPADQAERDEMTRF